MEQPRSLNLPPPEVAGTAGVVVQGYTISAEQAERLLT